MAEAEIRGKEERRTRRRTRKNQKMER